MDQEISIISTSTVQPADQAAIDDQKIRRIELTPWDLRLLPVEYNQKGILFHKPAESPPQEKDLLLLPPATTLIDHLKLSLSRTLAFFPPLAGTLIAHKNHDNTTSFSVDCNDAGALFVHAVADNLTINHIIESQYVPPVVYSFFPLTGVPSYEGVSNPLLAIQVTELQDGLFIGCSMNHSLADGISFWHFFNSWAEISRGLNHISKTPILKRWFPDDVTPPISIPSPLKGVFNSDFEAPRHLKKPPVMEKVFLFTRENLVKLKAKANAEMNTTKISSLQSLLSHVWRSVVRYRGDKPDEQIQFRLQVGLRRRIHPPLPEEYFGNVFQAGVSVVTPRELQSNGLGWAALQLSKIVDSHTTEEVIEFYKNWVENPQTVNLASIKYFSTANSPRFNVYGNDFGWGKPIATRGGAGDMSDGRLIVSSGLEEGSIEIEVCSSLETLRALEEDAEFMEAMAV